MSEKHAIVHPVEQFVEDLDIGKLLAGQEDHYRAVYGLEVDLAGLPVPRLPFDKFQRPLLVVIAGLTPERAYRASQKFFKCSKATGRNLDEIAAYEARKARASKSITEPYAFWTEDVLEATDGSECFKLLSADQVVSTGIPSETLTERLAHGLLTFKTTGKHLDVKSVTLCPGSRNSSGRVSSARWSSDRGALRVNWYSPGCSSDDLLPREVVV